MNQFTGLRNRYVFLLDVLFLSLIPTAALFLRIEEKLFAGNYWNSLFIYTICTVALRLILYVFGGLYKRYWRYASVEDLLQIISVSLVSAILIVSLFFTVRVFIPFDIPRSVPFIDSVLALLVTAGVRFSIRVFVRTPNRMSNAKTNRMMIMGAGDAGAAISREILNTPDLGMELIGFLDDDKDKHGVWIHGIPVLGGRQHIRHVVNDYELNEIIIAMPSAPGKIIREVVRICEKCNIKVRTMPGLYNLLNGSVSVNQLREVNIDDLLRRNPIQTDIDAVRQLVHHQVILITGAGGSIGSELCRQIWQCRPKQIVLVGHGENSIFDIHNELRRSAQQLDLDPERYVAAVIGDIRFPQRIQQIVRKYRPHIIFHAAAHKHVPLMEHNPAEAITNNVIGTRNIVNAAVDNNVAHFVMISTDKAVNPTNVMGGSKRVAELLVHQAAHKSGRPYVAVRFGNVLGSRGSVIHTFRRQILAGGPITITHPDITRFFMTIPEAVQLVLQAAVLGSGGEVFVLDMGEPVKIVDLARDLIALSGLENGRDIDIEYIGLRPGEKLYEELFIGDEAYVRTAHEKIFHASNAGSLVPIHLDSAVDRLHQAALDDDRLLILLELKRLIPGFKPTTKETKEVTLPIYNRVASSSHGLHLKHA